MQGLETPRAAEPCRLVAPRPLRRRVFPTYNEGSPAGCGPAGEPLLFLLGGAAAGHRLHLLEDVNVRLLGRERARGRVHIRCQRTERADRGLLARDVAERVEAVEVTRVPPRD